MDFFARRFPGQHDAHAGVGKESVSPILPVGSAMRERIILLASQLVAVSADTSQRNTDGTPRRTAILKAMCTTLRSLPMATVRPTPVFALEFPIATPSTADTWSNSFGVARNFGSAGGAGAAGAAAAAARGDGRGAGAESARARRVPPGSEAALADAAAPRSTPHWLDDFPELHTTTMSSHAVAGSSAMVTAAEEEAKSVLLSLDALLGNEQKRAVALIAHAEDEDAYRTPDGKKRKSDVITAYAVPAPDGDHYYDGGCHFDAMLTMSDLEGMIGGISSAGDGDKTTATTPLYRPPRASAECAAPQARAHDFDDDWMAALEPTTATTAGVGGGCANAERADSRAMRMPPTFGGALLII